MPPNLDDWQVGHQVVGDSSPAPRRPAPAPRRQAVHPGYWALLGWVIFLVLWLLAAQHLGDQHIVTRALWLPAAIVIMPLGWLFGLAGGGLIALVALLVLAGPLFLVVFLAVGAALKVFGRR